MQQERVKHVVDEPVAATVISHRFSHAVWGAVFAGTVVAMTTQLTFALLGSGIGLSLGQAAPDQIRTIGVGAMAWWILSGAVSLYVGGWVSGRMAGIPRALDGALHGVLTWSLVSIISLLFVTTAIGMMTVGALGMIKTGVSDAAAGMTSPASRMAAENPQISGEVDQWLDQQGLMGADRSRLRPQLMQAVQGLVMAGDAQEQRQQAVSLLTQEAGIGPEEAQNTIDRWSQNLEGVEQQMQQQAAEAAQTASQAASQAAWASFIMLLVGAVAAGFGGSVGSPHWSEQEIS